VHPVDSKRPRFGFFGNASEDIPVTPLAEHAVRQDLELMRNLGSVGEVADHERTPVTPCSPHGGEERGSVNGHVKLGRHDATELLHRVLEIGRRRDERLVGECGDEQPERSVRLWGIGGEVPQPMVLTDLKLTVGA
jgi:hypothetical protein